MAVEEEQRDKTVRIFVGGLGESVTAEDLRRLFGSLGIVEGVQTIRTKGRSFAYVDFLPSPTDQKSLPKLFSKYNGCLWKGGKLRLEKAKEHYLARLKREWEEDAAAAELVSSEPVTSNIGEDKLEEKSHARDSLKTKHLHIYFPRLKKVKSIPFIGTGKHKYSFQNIKVPPLPVHFCDCEEHCSPSGAERGKLYFDRATESGGMNNEEINVMNAVMKKLFEKENVSSKKHLENEQDSFESPDALHSDECEVDSATDEDDLIINMDTEKNKSALIGSEELERILENQESWLNKTRVAKEEPNKKRKSLPTLERESNGCVFTTDGSKSNMQTLPEKLGSGAEPSESEDDDFGESTKVSWSQKSSWKQLLGDGGNTAFSASLILPKFDSGEEEERSDSPSPPIHTSDKTEDTEGEEHQGSKPTIHTNDKTEDTEGEEHQGSKPTNTEAIKELTEAHPTNTQVIEEHFEAQPTDKNVAPNKTGRGTSWRQKQSWTQLVSVDNNSFSISQILSGVTFPEPITKEPIVDSANSNDCKGNGEVKDPINEVVIPEKSQHVGVNDIASAPIVEKKIETRPREGSSEETMPKERSTSNVEIGETCTFMRSSASLKEWAKAKAAMRGSLKRKRGEK